MTHGAGDERDQHWMHSTGTDGRSVPAVVRSRWQWHRDGSVRHRRRYMAAEFTGICCAAAIPLAAALRLDTSVLAALGALVVLATGARTLSGSHENWVEFSQIRYGIEREAALFLVGAAPYDGDDAMRSLVTRVEDLTAAGGERWAARRIHLAQASPPQLGGTDPSHTDGQQ